MDIGDKQRTFNNQAHELLGSKWLMKKTEEVAYCTDARLEFL